MTSKTRCRARHLRSKIGLNLVPAPRSSEDVLLLIRRVAEVTPGGTNVAAHLAEVGQLFPRELLAAFRAFLKRQIGRN